MFFMINSFQCLAIAVEPCLNLKTKNKNWTKRTEGQMKINLGKELSG